MLKTNYQHKRFIVVKNGKIFDTTFLYPHQECYLEKVDDESGEITLYMEMIDGSEMYLGKVINEADTISGLMETPTR